VTGLLQIPELRGFEKFAVGRPAEDMPQITSRICGVCPTAHHMAATKALDAVYRVTPPSSARKIRELVYSTFMVEDHAHFASWAAGLVVVPTARRRAQHPCVIGKFGIETGRRLLSCASRAADCSHGGKGSPGGSAGRRPTSPSTQKQPRTPPWKCRVRQVHLDLKPACTGYVDLILSTLHPRPPHGLMDDRNRTNFYDGRSVVAQGQGGRNCLKKYLDSPTRRTMDL
jgi:F420-non-reducing hydrogenase large subunit